MVAFSLLTDIAQVVNFNTDSLLNGQGWGVFSEFSNALKQFRADTCLFQDDPANEARMRDFVSSGIDFGRRFSILGFRFTEYFRGPTVEVWV